MTPLKQFRPHGISVSDLSGQMWCEQQLLFGYLYGRARTREMEQGSTRHQSLHEEVAELVDVVPRTMADVLAVQLHNCKAGVLRLRETGMTRELPVFGKVNTLFVRGVIDELKLEGEGLRLIDTKTRQSPTMPREDQKRAGMFQLMLYRHLLDNTLSRTYSFRDLLKEHHCTTKTEISRELASEVRVLLPGFQENLYLMAQEAFAMLQSLPPVDDFLELRYEHAETKSLLGIVEFRFEKEQFRRSCDIFEEFWLGRRDARKVPEQESWKCDFCEFRGRCTSS